MNDWNFETDFFYKTWRVKKVEDASDSAITIGTEIMNDENWVALKILNTSVQKFKKLVVINKKSEAANDYLSKTVYISGEYNLTGWTRDPIT